MSIFGSRKSDGWEMKFWGPKRMWRSYTLAGNVVAAAFGNRYDNALLGWYRREFRRGERGLPLFPNQRNIVLFNWIRI